ncbi:MAG TPA: hypothetical protein VMY42_16285 [Thermoguttaceae bacterium]|nr:hypothetical protein [Thermoguttaceae bacterium]
MKRAFLRVATVVFALLGVAELTAAVLCAEPTYEFTSGRELGQTDRVTVVLEVGGDVINKVEGKIERAKMSVVCNLNYAERTLEVPRDDAGRWRAVRYYDQATAVVKVSEDGLKLTLSPQRQLIGAEIEAEEVTLFAPQGPLTRDELELIDVQGNSLLLDRFLPQEPVAVGDTWKHSEGLVAALLGVERVAEADVRSTLGEVTDTVARFDMSGRVEGAVYGVTTEISVKAKYRFDLRRKRIDWFTMLVEEKRNASPVADGVDAVARLKVQIEPSEGAAELADAALQEIPSSATAAMTELAYASAEGGWRFTHDRRWHVYRDQPQLAVLRMMDRGELIAQCNVSSLPKLPPEKTVSLGQFQEEVKKALGEGFEEFAEVGQWEEGDDRRVYQVNVRGKASEMPIQWNYYLIVDGQGRRVVFAFTFESRLADRFQGADRNLVRSLRFADAKLADGD